MPTALHIEPWPYATEPLEDDGGLVGVGADLEPETIISAYLAGLFPMPGPGHDAVGWWSPDPRGIFPLEGLRVSRSLRRSLRRFEIRFDTAFDEVIGACANPLRQGAWISPAIRHAYQRLHELGWAHSVEAFTPEGKLAGGLYGISIGGFFAGESMFHVETDASKVALFALVELLGGAGSKLLDVQWTTPHLISLGATDLPREDYLERLAEAVATDVDPWAS